MSLENLLRIGQPKSHPADAVEIERLLTAAQRNLRDADVAGISTETRFDAAYKCIMQCALFRPKHLRRDQQRLQSRFSMPAQ